jgi:hypothetical protein
MCHDKVYMSKVSRCYLPTFMSDVISHKKSILVYSLCAFQFKYQFVGQDIQLFTQCQLFYYGNLYLACFIVSSKFCEVKM